MSHHPDDPFWEKHPDGVDRSEPDPPAGDPGPEGAYDEDAIWREIIENYGDRPTLVEPDAPVVEPDTPLAEPGETKDRPRNLFDTCHLDPLNSEASWEDEGHFVPPEPPPLPQLDPRRKLAWGGLFGAPLLLLLAVVFGWIYPTWLVALLVAAFVGGFVYLVATMPSGRHDDWSGDDGAVV